MTEKEKIERKANRMIDLAIEIVSIRNKNSWYKVFWDARENNEFTTKEKLNQYFEKNSLNIKYWLNLAKRFQDDYRELESLKSKYEFLTITFETHSETFYWANRCFENLTFMEKINEDKWSNEWWCSYKDLFLMSQKGLIKDELDKDLEKEEEKTKIQKETTNLTVEKVNSKTKSQKEINTGLKTKPKSRDDDEWER